jgi:hypothetical protein
LLAKSPPKRGRRVCSEARSHRASGVRLGGCLRRRARRGGRVGRKVTRRDAAGQAGGPAVGACGGLLPSCRRPERVAAVLQPRRRWDGGGSRPASPDGRRRGARELASWRLASGDGRQQDSSVDGGGVGSLMPVGTPIFRHTQNSPVGGLPGAGGLDSGGVAREGAGGGPRDGRRPPGGGGHGSRYISRQMVQNPYGPPFRPKMYFDHERSPPGPPAPSCRPGRPPGGADRAGGREGRRPGGCWGRRGLGWDTRRFFDTPKFRQLAETDQLAMPTRPWSPRRGGGGHVKMGEF